MCQGDDLFGSLPCVFTDEVYDALFRYDIVGLRTRRSDNVTLRKSRKDIALQLSVSVLANARHAEEGVTSHGKHCALYKVHLTACAGNLPCAGAFGANLTIDIGGNAAIYGYLIRVLAYDVRIVDIAYQIRLYTRIVSDPVI